MVFHSTPATNWAAMTSWNPEYFSSIRDYKFKVYQNDGPIFTYFSSNTPLYNAIPPRPVHETRMKISEFFEFTKKNSSFAYFSAALSDFPKKIAQDVEPMEWMNVNIGSNVKPSKMVWIGVGGGKLQEID